MLKPNAWNWIRAGPLKTCFLLLIASMVIEIPDYMGNMPGSATMQLSPTESFTVWFLNNTPFASTKFGSILLFVVYIVRDLGTLVTQIILNCVSFYLFKNHLKQKMQLTVHARNLNTVHNNGSLSIDTSSVRNQTAATVHITAAPHGDRLSNAELKAVVMVAVICAVSSVEHLLTFVGFVFPIYNISFTTFVLYAVLQFSWLFRCLLDVALFYFFNLNFKRIVNGHFRWLFNDRSST
jgi:hypothetical protein